jgi:metal-responsive CopG/Arc/MetJ family transcriptional regulator
MGRPSVGATPVNVRFPPNELAELDAWIKSRDDEPSRPEAVRRIVDTYLSDAPRENDRLRKVAETRALGKIERGLKTKKGK